MLEVKSTQLRLKQARREDFVAGDQNAQGGQHFLKTILDVCSNRGATDFKWEGRAPLAAPLATALG